MPIKVVFNNQTHRISKHPADYNTLLQKVTEIFGAQLPQNWTLQYLDSDEDKIMLNSQEDYKTLLEEEVGASNKSVKIFVFPLEGKMSQSQVKVEEPVPVALVEAEKKEENAPVEKREAVIEDNYLVIESQNKEEVAEPVVQQEIKEEAVAQGEKQEEVAEPVLQQPVEEKLVIEEGPKVEEVQAEPQQEESRPNFEHPLHKFFFKLVRPQENVAEKKEKLLAKFNKFQQRVQEKQQKIQEKKQRIQQHIAEKQARQKNELRAAVTEIIYEQLPIIASLTKEFIQDNTLPQVPRTENNASVHRGVRCDGCRAFPIVGIRYKCYVCPDFDYCEKCEASKEHSHPFIKFKQPQEQRPHPFIKRGPCFERPDIRQFLDGVFNHVQMNEAQKLQEQPKVEVPEPVVQKVEEVVIEEIKPEENNAEPAVVDSAEPLIEEVKPEEILPVVEEVLIEEVKPEEIKEKQYDAKTLEKAQKLKEMFNLDMAYTLAFISQCPDMSIEELVGQGL